MVGTMGFRDDLWLHRKGNPLTNAAKSNRAIRRPNYGNLEIEVTVNDPKAYTNVVGSKAMRKTFNAVWILGAAFAGMSVNASAAKCDRACLDKTVDTYIAAMVAHDPSQVAFATDVKFVENTVPMKPGEGLWKTASEAPSTFKIYIPDPVASRWASCA
jgi:hypothetical protein